MRAFKLDQATGDIVREGASLARVDGIEAIRQSCQIHLQFFKGEWFLDLDAGVPYFQEVLVKGTSPNALQSIFREQILAVPGILAINSLNLTYDGASRSLSVTYSASSDLGEISDTVSI